MSAPSARPPARERLLDAATDLFHSHGIAATGVDAVLRHAGVAPATLYAHFAGKDGLVAAYLERRFTRWRDTWDAALAACEDEPVARAVSVFDALAAFPSRSGDDGAGGGDPHPARGCAFLAAAVEIPGPEHPAHPWLLADTDLLRDRLHQLSTEVGASDPGALAAELLALYDGALAARVRIGLGDDGRRRLDLFPARELALAAVARHTA